MASQTDFNNESIEKLRHFLSYNDTTDFATFDLMTESSTDSLTWKELSSEKGTIVPLLKGYQRLLRIVPEGHADSAIKLLSAKFHSALQIAAMTQRAFIDDAATPLSDKTELAKEIYANALRRRELILLQYMDILQDNEPHLLAARFN